MNISEIKQVLPHYVVVSDKGALLGSIMKIMGSWQFVAKEQIMTATELQEIRNKIVELESDVK